MRRQNIFAVILSLVAVFLLAGCAEGESETLFSAGTYTTEAEGYGGVFEVETKLTDTEIESMKCWNHSEQKGIGTADN